MLRPRFKAQAATAADSRVRAGYWLGKVSPEPERLSGMSHLGRTFKLGAALGNRQLDSCLQQQVENCVWHGQTEI